MSKLWQLLIGVLLLCVVTIWIGVFQYENKFQIIACDVGQGDAILATYGKTQILTDGGLPNGKVISCLSKYMPFWDRTVELVINTHPQLDHYGGLIDVVSNYKIKNFMTSSLDSSSQEYRVLVNEVGSKGINVITPTSGQRYVLGLIQLEILWPTIEFVSSNSKSLSHQQLNASDKVTRFTSSNDPNDFSLNTIITFGSFDALLTGDIGPDIENLIIDTRRVRDIEYIKVPHHGSKNGLTQQFLNYLSPEIAVISSGKDNRYGHPHKEIIDMLNGNKITLFRTDEGGNVSVQTDGQKIFVKK